MRRKRSRFFPCDLLDEIDFSAWNRPLIAGRSSSQIAPIERPSRARFERPRKHSTTLLLSSQFWPIPSMSRRGINCAKLCLGHPFSRIKGIGQWAVDRAPALTSTASAKTGKTAIPPSKLDKRQDLDVILGSIMFTCAHRQDKASVSEIGGFTRGVNRGVPISGACKRA